jgi:hypothetical protein
MNKVLVKEEGNNDENEEEEAENEDLGLFNEL